MKSLLGHGLSLASLVWFIPAVCFGQIRITNLGTFPGGDASYARGVSADGSAVVGESEFPPNSWRAFRWTIAEGMANLGEPQGGSYSTAKAISADGSAVVGDMVVAGVGQRAFRWTALGGMVDLGTLPGANNSMATGVSSNGSVVAGSSGTYRAFRWTAAEGIVDIGVPIGANGAYATAVNGDGSVIVGIVSYNNANYLGNHAFRWTTEGGIRELPASYYWWEAFGTNRNGSIAVGSGVIYQCCIRALRWIGGGPAQDLGSLGQWAYARAVSDDGSVVVGLSYIGTTERAFLWTPVLNMVDLNTYLPTIGLDLNGWSLSEATGVSADGSVVVGNGTFNGARRGWIVTGLPGSSPCGPGLIRDCNGNCAPASWIGDGICDSGFYRYNGVPIYFNCPQFGNDGGDCGAAQPPLTNPPNHGVPEIPPIYGPIASPTGSQNKLVLVTHGWNTSQSRFEGFWTQFRNTIREHGGPAGSPVGSDWQVEAYDWTEDSGTLLDGPGHALQMGVVHGAAIGRAIGQQHYQHVHLIAHSAGSALIAAAAYWIHQDSPSTTIHTTYLDAYAGLVIIPGISNYEQAYGVNPLLNVLWSDHCWTPIDFENQLAPDPLTDLRLPLSFNVNVARLNPSCCPTGPVGSHAWPCCFYSFSVNGNVVGDCESPAGNSQNWLHNGFPLSYERWTEGGGVEAWASRRRLDQPPGAIVTLERADIPPPMVFRTRRDPSFNLLAVPSFSSNAQAVQIATDTLNMSTQPFGAPNSAPAWVNFEFTTSASINFIAFDMDIAGDPGAAGLVTIYIDGAKCGVVDQLYTLPGLQPQSIPTPGDLTPGQHFVSFRLDPINAMRSDLSIQNVATGMSKFTSACYGNCDESTVPPLFTANDFQCFLNKFASQDPYANCDQSTGIPSLTANDFQCFLNAFAAGCL